MYILYLLLHIHHPTFSPPSPSSLLSLSSSQNRKTAKPRRGLGQTSSQFIPPPPFPGSRSPDSGFRIPGSRRPGSGFPDPRFPGCRVPGSRRPDRARVFVACPPSPSPFPPACPGLPPTHAPRPPAPPPFPTHPPTHPPTSPVGWGTWVGHVGGGGKTVVNARGGCEIYGLQREKKCHVGGLEIVVLFRGDYGGYGEVLERERN